MDHELFVLKGLVAILALVLHLWHMGHSPRPQTWGRKLRFLGLVMAAGTIAFASQAQVRGNLEWTAIQSAALLTATVILTAAVVGLWEDRHDMLSPMKGHF